MVDKTSILAGIFFANYLHSKKTLTGFFRVEAIFEENCCMGK
jgi:hypothetical protein